MKKRVVIVCPGRGSYTKETLGYLKDHSQPIKDFLADIDNRRLKGGDPTVTELDGMEKFNSQVHMRGEHASALIYACSYADFLSIDSDQYEIVGVTGNSMGWYIALALSGALSPQDGYELIQTMGSMMREKIVGGQLIYPIMNSQWHLDGEKMEVVEKAVNEVNAQPGAKAFYSIFLGGYLVLAGNEEGLSLLSRKLPPVEHYPFRLIHHAAFHTPLLEAVSQRAFGLIPKAWFKSPIVPLIDGRGCVWSPYATDCEDLYQYTLGHQVTEPYDFTKAITVALKEFAPDQVILLGPGNTLGGVVGQIMIQNQWHNINSKSAFSERQKTQPILISMGL